MPWRYSKTRPAGPPRPNLQMQRDQLPVVLAAKAGDRAACQQLLDWSSPYLWSLARYYQRARRFRGSPKDLYQEGVLGLLEALARFDPDRETMFLTYAGFYANSAVQKAVEWHEPRTTQLYLETDLRQMERKDSPLDYYAGAEAAYDDDDLEQRGWVELPRVRGWKLLTLQERRVLCYRFGLCGRVELHDGVAIGRRLSITKSRVYQLLKSGLTWLHKAAQQPADVKLKRRGAKRQPHAL